MERERELRHRFGVSARPKGFIGGGVGAGEGADFAANFGGVPDSLITNNNQNLSTNNNNYNYNTLHNHSHNNNNNNNNNINAKGAVLLHDGFQERVTWNKTSVWIFVAIMAVSFLTRYWNLGYPAQVLFDEVHFVSMAQWYSARKYFFDIHPPLAKLCLGLIAHLTGFHTDVPYREIGSSYQHEAYYWLRFWQATWGALLPAVAFFTVKTMGGSLAACALSASFIVFELGLQTISRAVLLDSFLYFNIGMAFLCGLHMWKASSAFQMNHSMGGLGIWFWCLTLLTGTFMGFAFAIKHTGLMIVGVIGVVHLIMTFKPLVVKGWQRLRHGEDRPLNYSYINNMFSAGVVMIFLIVAIHIISFVIHFKVMIYTGVDEDSMSDNYRSQLIGSTIKLPQGEAPQGMWTNIYQINKKMLEVNMATFYEHYYCSPWYEWPIMYRGIMYDWINLPDGRHACVYLFGNPFVYWTVLLSLIVSLIYCDRLTHLSFTPYGLNNAQRTYFFNIGVCVFGWFSNMLPYLSFVKRPTYMYHYHPSLYMGILVTGLLFDVFTARLKPKTKLILAGIIVLIIFFVYLFYLPFGYAWPLTEEEHERRRWFKKYFPTW
jgi:dolichyl-phosphate-mannose--protein O-mannosyl transferase